MLAFVLPLGLDSFAVAAAIAGAGPLTNRQRWRISAVFVLFEGGMPLIGFGLGAPVAHAIGSVADYVAGAVLIAVGGWMIAGDDDEGADRLAAASGLALVALGLSISLDELAIGFTLGLAHVPAAIVIPAIAAQALVGSQLGMLVGTRIGERLRENAERLAGAALIGLGIYLLVARAAG